MHQYLTLLGRHVGTINLDPANERIGEEYPKQQQQDEDVDDEAILPYTALLDVCQDVVNLTSVMEQLNLGPNGGLVYCMEYLEAHAEQIIAMIQARIKEHDITYLLLDLPGQVELYTHGTCVQNLLNKLSKALDLRLCAIQLVDATYTLDVTKFLSAALLSTTVMLRLELPSISILSKMDLLTTLSQQQQELPFSIDYFLECQELDRLVEYLESGGGGSIDYDANYADDPDYQEARQKTRNFHFFRKYKKLHEKLAEVVNDFGLLSFLPIDISNAESVGRIVAKVDKCNGYVFSTGKSVQEDLFQCAIQADSVSSKYETIADIQERLYYDSDEHHVKKRDK
jgi:GTPase SAR1 family protein